MSPTVRRLLSWFDENQRPLPWRKNRDPYRIWISEIMLQQTTTTAVIPYFERFLQRFPDVETLATSTESEVIKYWAGLGYYSRARNIHRAANEIYKMRRFPKSHSELSQLPGLGPYTSRAISSQAFGEPAGVVDGNVVRLLTRKHNLKIEWWKSAGQKRLQSLADEFVQKGNPGEINQALMELGSTICTPKNPKCLLCPWTKECLSRQAGNQTELPLPKPKRAREVWVWEVHITEQRKRWALVENRYAPFLKGHLIFPGKVKMQKSKPKSYDLRHSVTHHDIYINLKNTCKITEEYKTGDLKWLSRQQVNDLAASSVIGKIFDTLDT